MHVETPEIMVKYFDMDLFVWSFGLGWWRWIGEPVWVLFSKDDGD